MRRDTAPAGGGSGVCAAPEDAREPGVVHSAALADSTVILFPSSLPVTVTFLPWNSDTLSLLAIGTTLSPAPIPPRASFNAGVHAVDVGLGALVVFCAALGVGNIAGQLSAQATVVARATPRMRTNRVLA